MLYAAVQIELHLHCFVFSQCVIPFACEFQNYFFLLGFSALSYIPSVVHLACKFFQRGLLHYSRETGISNCILKYELL